MLIIIIFFGLIVYKCRKPRNDRDVVHRNGEDQDGAHVTLFSDVAYEVSSVYTCVKCDPACTCTHTHTHTHTDTQRHIWAYHNSSIGGTFKKSDLSFTHAHDVNGIPRGFQVSYTPHGESDWLHDVAKNTTSTELTCLRPHTEYIIRVRAKTMDYDTQVKKNIL